MAQVGVNRLRGLATVRRGMDDGLRTIGDVTGCKDTRRAGRECVGVHQETAPGRQLDAGAFRQEGWIRSLADGNQHNIDRHVEFISYNGNWLAASVRVGIALSHALAADSGDVTLCAYEACRRDKLIQLDAFFSGRSYLLDLCGHLCLRA